MLLAHVAATSRQIAATAKRLAKIKLLADLLKQLTPAEIEIVVPFLSGSTRQGRIGVGYAAVRDAQTAAAPEPTLEVIEVDRQLDALAQSKQKSGPLRSLLALATEDEQQFLKELLLGGLRQGALEGLMLEALASASGVSLDRIRRAAMMAGDVPRVARFRIRRGFAGRLEYLPFPARATHAGADRRGCRRSFIRIG